MHFQFLEGVDLHERKSVIKKVTIIKTRVYEESGDSSGSGKVKSRTYTTEVCSKLHLL